MTSIYEQLGGDAGVRELVDAFYDTMQTLPEAAQIRAMHPADLTSSRQHLHLFLNMWTGGPQTYMEQRGHPRMRARHLPFPIDEAARDAWLACMVVALEARVPDENLRGDLFSAFARIADHMRNQ
jgi:hemoglobin